MNTRAKKFCIFWSEATRDQHSVSLVLRTLHCEDHPVFSEKRIRIHIVKKDSGFSYAEKLRILTDRLNVCVFCYGPKSRTIWFVMPKHRSIGSQPFILIKRMPVLREVLGINEIDSWCHDLTP